MSKCEFRQEKIEYLERITSNSGIAPIEKRVTDYLKKRKLPTSVKALQCYLCKGFVNFYRSADKNAILHTFIEKDTPFKLERSHKDTIFEINEALLKATILPLK